MQLQAFRRVSALLGAVIGLTVVAGPASAQPREFGTNVTRISHGRMVTFVNGSQTGSFPIASMRVRGNSSALWPKKPFGVVLKSDASVLGLPAGRKFRLLANYHDRSLLRNKISFDLADKIVAPRWTSHTAFTELFVGGTYRGSYLIAEEITRANLGLPRSGLVAEFDKNAVHADRSGMLSAPKDPESAARMGAMIRRKVNPFLADLRRGGSDWQNDIDFASFVDYYLVREFTKDNDSDFLFSNFYYTDDVRNRRSKIFMGPVWDFDQSAGNELGIKHNGVISPAGWWVRYHRGSAAARRTHLPWAKKNWYNQLVTKPAFTAALCQRWQQTAPIFADVAYGGIASAEAALGGDLVAGNDRARWGLHGPGRPRSRGSWRDEVTFLQGWYAARYQWMNAHIC